MIVLPLVYVPVLLSSVDGVLQPVPCKSDATKTKYHEAMTGEAVWVEFYLLNHSKGLF